MVEFCENIYSYELSNQRYSNILFINIFIIYHSLNKFKRSLIPPIGDLLTKIDDNKIYTLLELLMPFLNYPKKTFFTNLLSSKEVINNSKNIFLIKMSGFNENILFKSNVDYKIVKNNKIDEIKNLKSSLTFTSLFKYQILGKYKLKEKEKKLFL